MSQTQTPQISGPQILRPIDVRYIIKQLIIARPEVEVLAPTFQAVGNEVGAAFAVASLALRTGKDITQKLDQYVDSIKAHANKRTEKLGVTHEFTYSAQVGQPLAVTTKVSGPKGQKEFSYTFDKVDADFSDEYTQGLVIGKDRWRLYTEYLKPSDIEKIFDLAKMGYQMFLSGDTLYEVMAKLKHEMAMEAAKGRAQEIINTMKQAVDRYYERAVWAKDKYKYNTQEIAFPAIMYGLKYLENAVQVV